MIFRATKAIIRKRHKYDWRVILLDKWGGVVFSHHYQSYAGAYEFVMTLIYEAAHQKKTLTIAEAVSGEPV